MSYPNCKYNSSRRTANSLKAQERKISENRTILNGMVSETSEMKNQLGIATLTIERLRAELARVDHYIIHSKDHGAKLRIQAEKLEREKTELSQKYEATLSKIESQIKRKEQEVGEVNTSRNSILGIRDEEMQRSKEFTKEIKTMDSMIKLLKNQIANQSSWSVRGSFDIGQIYEVDS